MDYANEDCTSKNGGGMPLLCDDIVEDILRRLPVKSLIRFKLVCKKWHALFSNPRFTKMHLNFMNYNRNVSHIHIDYGFLEPEKHPWLISLAHAHNQPSEIQRVEIQNPFHCDNLNHVEVFGSCNGLLLVAIGHESFLWNPSIREHVKLFPDNEIWAIDFTGDDDRCAISGLGYNSVLDEYTAIILATKEIHGVLHQQMFIYNSRIGYWKEDANHDFPYFLTDDSDPWGVTVNGFPHWLVHVSREDTSRAAWPIIIYLDTIDEIFKRVPTPICWRDCYNYMPYITLLGRCLSAIQRSFVQDCIDVWVMNEYGIEASWTKLFVLRSPADEYVSFVPMGFMNNGDELLVEVLGIEKMGTYNLKTGEEKLVPGTANKISGIKSVAYVSSLVSPHSVQVARR